MKKLIFLLISIVLLITACSDSSITKSEFEEISAKKYRSYDKYILKKGKEAVDRKIAQEEKIEKEKKIIDLMIEDLKDNIEIDDFLEYLLNERKSYLESIKDLTEEQVGILEDYLNISLKPLEEQYAIIQVEKVEVLLKLEEKEKQEKQVKQEKPKISNPVEKELPQISDNSEKDKEIIDSNKNETTDVESEITPETETELDNSPTYKNGILIVNKKHPLPSSYNPGEDPVAARQLKNMISDMQKNGFSISNSYSGFRTYNYQKNLYERYVRLDGKKVADTYSARPGHSEHQSGLTFDLIHTNGTLVETEPEVTWISENASQYGFIVRYQSGKENITGYQAEPWHLRYIGDEANNIFNSGLTLEEYLGIDGGDYYNN